MAKTVDPIRYAVAANRRGQQAHREAGLAHDRLDEVSEELEQLRLIQHGTGRDLENIKRRIGSVERKLERLVQQNQDGATEMVKQFHQLRQALLLVEVDAERAKERKEHHERLTQAQEETKRERWTTKALATLAGAITVLAAGVWAAWTNGVIQWITGS